MSPTDACALMWTVFFTPLFDLLGVWPQIGRGGDVYVSLVFTLHLFFKDALCFFLFPRRIRPCREDKEIIYFQVHLPVPFCLIFYIEFFLYDWDTNHLFVQASSLFSCKYLNSETFFLYDEIFRSFAVSTLVSSIRWSYSPNTKLPLFTPLCTSEPKKMLPRGWLRGGGRHNESENDLPLDVWF